MSETRIENARITSTRLGTEDHGIFTAYVMVEGDGWGVGFGGYAFDSYDPINERRLGAGYGIEFIAQLMKAVGVDAWEKLPGTHVRVETEGWGGKCKRIGHIVKAQWFDPEQLAREMKARDAVAR